MLDLVSRFLHDHGLVLLCFAIVAALTGYVCHARLRRLRKREQLARQVEDALLQNAQGLILNVHGIVKDLAANDPMRQRMERALDRADEQLSEDRERVQDLRVEMLDDGLPPCEAAPEAASLAPTAREATARAGASTTWHGRVLRWLRFERRR